MSAPTLSFPMALNFTVISAQASVVATVEDRLLSAGAKAYLRLRAEKGTPVRLSTGERLEDLEVHLSLLSRRNDSEVNEYISQGALGFLCHVPAGPQDSTPYIHGRAYLPEAPLPPALFGGADRASCVIELSDLPMLGEFDRSYIWSPLRQNSLRISSFSISCEKLYAPQLNDRADA